MKCYTVEYDAHGSEGIVRNRIGQFETVGDAKRYVEDVLKGGRARPVIREASSNTVMEWRRETK